MLACRNSYCHYEIVTTFNLLDSLGKFRRRQIDDFLFFSRFIQVVSLGDFDIMSKEKPEPSKPSFWKHKKKKKKKKKKKDISKCGLLNFVPK